MKKLVNGELVDMSADEIATVEAERLAISKPNAELDRQITDAPDDLFGGPTLQEIFNGD